MQVKKKVVVADGMGITCSFDGIAYSLDVRSNDSEATKRVVWKLIQFFEKKKSYGRGVA